MFQNCEPVTQRARAKVSHGNNSRHLKRLGLASRYVSHPSSYFLWLPLTEEARADRITMALMQEQISVSTAEPFATSLHVPHAIRLALGSVDIQSLKSALQRVASVVGFHS